MRETERTEFKSTYTDEIYKEVIAFANTEGGVIYVGVDDKGTALGLSDITGDYTRITNGIRDAVMPDVTMFVQYSIQENDVIRIIVSEGTNKPYYLKGKGIKPSGVYVRQGASSVPASHEQIRSMIKASDGDKYEDARSVEQDLTFLAAEAAFRQYGVEFGEEKFLSLGIMKNGIYTNLGLLLSDQCRHTTKVAVFNDESCTEFRDRKEFGGSVFKQFEDTMSYLALCNKTASKISGTVRTDRKDYPDEAIREAFLNALVHRDYGYSGSIIVNVNNNKMEFISLGGLLPGLSPDDIRIGISQPRNKKLADVFYRLRLIESYGTGIRRIFRLYEGFDVQPGIDITENGFKITLPNMNEARPQQHLTEQMKRVLDFVAENGFATDSDLMQLLGIRQTRLYNLMRQMSDMRLIKIEGKGKAKHYTAVKA